MTSSDDEDEADFLNLREKYMENFKIHLIKIKSRFYWYYAFSKALKEKNLNKIRSKNINVLYLSFYFSFLKLQYASFYLKRTFLLLLKKKNEE